MTFGTGYSSLSYIAKLPVNVLKIDRAFIINMSTNPDDLTHRFRHHISGTFAAFACDCRGGGNP